MNPSLSKSSSHRHVQQDLRNVLGLSVTWVCAVALVNPGGDFPLMDDWVYGLTVRNILETGHFRLISAASANLIAQSYWGALFCLPTGFSFVALRASTIVIAALGIISFYGLIREIGCRGSTATIASLLLLLNPFYLGLANTFMTDVPFTALLIISLHAFTVALRREKLVYLIAALLAIVLALGIRQYALIFIAAFSIGFVAKRGFRSAAIWQAIAVVSAATGLQVLYRIWLSGQILNGGDPVTNSYMKGAKAILSAEYPKMIITILVYTGAFILPLLLIYLRSFLINRRSKYTRGELLLGLSVSVFTIAILVHFPLPRLGNILTHWGLGPLTLRDTTLLGLNNPPITPVVYGIWSVLSVCGALGFGITFLLLLQASRHLILNFRQSNRDARWSKSQSFSGMDAWVRPGFAANDTWLVAALLTGIMIYIGFIAIGHVFDRYILPLFPLVMALACVFIKQSANSSGNSMTTENLHWPTKAQRWASQLIIIFLTTFYAYLSIASAHDYMAWNHARWQALDSLTKTKSISPRLIDGGYEFNGWHLSWQKNYRTSREKSYWWVDKDDYQIASGPVPGYEQVDSYPFKRWLPLNEKPVLILKKSGLP